MSDARRLAAITLLLGAGLLRGDVEATPPCAGAEPALEFAGAAFDTGKWGDAERRLQSLSASHPDCGKVALGLARLRAAQDDPAEAERLFARATTLAPDDAVIHARFAEFQLSRGLHPQAEYLTSQALALDPDCPEALVVKGQILSRTGQIQEARRVLEKAADLDPANAEVHYQLGVWFFRVHRFDKAVPRFEEAVTLHPLQASAHDYLALSLEMLGEAERADRAYRNALEANEGPFFDPSLDSNYGRFLLKQGRLEECRAHLDRAVVLLPDRRGPRYERAKLHLALEDYEAARKDAVRALNIRDPSGRVLDLQVYFLLATVYARLGEMELAQKYAELSRTTQIPDQIEDGRR